MIRHIVFFFIIIINIIFLNFFHQKKILNETKVIILPGMKLDQISNTLIENSLIESNFLFSLWVKINFAEKNLKFGEYKFEDKVSVFEILKKLRKGETISRKITIIEGSSKNDLLNLLNEIDPENILSIEDIPDKIVANTYFYSVTDKNDRILKHIVKKSNNIIEKIWNNRDINSPLNTPNELSILASIVEKETSLKDEKPLIAGVFYNRFKNNMRLQSDPTVVYAITQGKRKLNRKLLRKDLKIKSKYNTYSVKGLPPSPICFPGIESLEGSANPIKSDFLYFVSNYTDGGHIFAKSYKEHLKNIKRVKNLRKEYE
ncbi:MAG: endolytic transglycosylase MltG [Alphaproteobacteria bacterium]